MPGKALARTLMLLMRSCTPPRSPPDMPSTSSMMSACFFTLPSKLTAQFVTISFTMFAHLPFRPDFTSDSAYTHTVIACARVHVRNVRFCAPRAAHLAASVAGVDLHDIEAECFANNFCGAGFTDAGRAADQHRLFGRIFPLRRSGLAQVRAERIESVACLQCMLPRRSHRCHSLSQPRRSEMSLPLPTSCATLCGLCFSTQSWFKIGPAHVTG